MHIWIIGSGYVGLTTGCVFAYLGHKVRLLDTDREKIASLQAGRIPFHEKGLQELYSQSSDNISFTADWEAFTPDADLLLLAVGTPPLATGEVDLAYLHAAARQIGQRCGAAIPPIVIKSTVPVGTAGKLRSLIEQERAERQLSGRVDVLSNPEFLREGDALQDAFYPDRIIVGIDHEQLLPLMERLYQPILKQQFTPPPAAPRPDGYIAPAFVVTNTASAEMIKYAGNAFLAMKISFINEFANLAEKVGANIADVATGIGLDRRIGPQFLQAGIGWGGSCFGKDTRAIVQQGKLHDVALSLVDAAYTANQRQRQRIISLLEEEIPVLEGRTIGLLGLAFKADTDDLRDAPAIDLIRQLLRKGARVKAYDPVAMDNGRMLFPEWSVTYCDSAEALFADAHAVILVTPWQQFRDLAFERLGERMADRPLLIDARNFLEPARLFAAGFQYRGIGLGHLASRQRVLVTGGAGFIGSHLVDQLLADGYDVHVVDCFDSFYERAIKEQNIREHLQAKRYQLSEVDICDRASLERIFQSFRPQLVIHLAARAGVRPSVQQPLSYVKANILGTTHLLDLSVQYGAKRFLFGSSSSVYGLNEKVPFAEDDPLLRCASPYAATKIAGEALCQSYANCYGLDVIVLRFFTVYGPRQRPDLAIHTFVKKMEEAQPIQLYGDGSTSRDYTFVTDIVDGIRRAMDVALSGYHVFNLGNAEPTGLLDLVRTLEQVLGKQAIIEWLPPQVGDVPATWADLAKSRRILQYQPKIPLSEGLRQYVAWYRSLP